MKNLSELLCEIWREICQHLAIEESARGVHRLLQNHLPVDYLLVRRWDPTRSRLETVGSSHLFNDLVTRVDLSTPRQQELLKWAAERKTGHWIDRQQVGLARLLVPEGLEGPVVAGPLHDGDRFEGVLLIGGQLPVSLALALLEPLAMALANDQRLLELARLREAADADRRALLSRLDRQDVSEAIIGAEAGLREVLSRVDQVARTDVPVLILGETGSGKEVVARAIHTRSRRANGPFLRINCGAIPPELVDSELFGHERGSFTGAIATRKGWFERADGGTLFLDELGELPAAAQVRLLRVLQDGSFSRVGGQENHTADVRIVAATHRDMQNMVRGGTFRQDLWYRISVFPINLPALRERTNDIPALARHLAERAGLRLYGVPLVPSEADLKRLSEYAWPGNVRELASVIERAAILGDGRRLDVPTALGGQPAEPRGGADDRMSIEDALRHCHGRIEGPFGAAQRLAVNPFTLRSRMRRLGIDWAKYRV